MYCQRISVAWRTASIASARLSGVVQWRSTIWYPRSPCTSSASMWTAKNSTSCALKP